MIIDWTQFAPLSALIGGLLIGLAASLFILLNGRVAGISGIVGGLLNPQRGDIAWRAVFIAGLMTSPWLYAFFGRPVEIRVDASMPMLIAAGLLVGVGTRYASGCTSGHGVCGVARGSARSIVATLIFMAAGFVSVYVVRHGLGA